MVEAPEPLAIQRLGLPRGVQPLPDVREGREIALQGQFNAGRQGQIDEIAPELDEEQDEVPQGDPSPRRPAGHGGSVDTDSIGKVLLRPTEIGQLPLDPRADGAAADPPAPP